MNIGFSADGSVVQTMWKYCSKKYSLLGIYFSWERGDQERRNIAQKYWPIGVYFPWEPGGGELISIAQNYRLLGICFPWVQVDRAVSAQAF